MMQSSENVSERLSRVIADNKGLDGPCLPTLIAIREEFGYVPAEAVPMLAEALNISRAEVHGVLTFYHELHTSPQGRHVVRLCRAESCQAAGCEAVAAEVEQKLGVKPGETSADGAVTLETVYCFGNCALSPAATVDGRLMGRITADSVLGAIAASGKAAE
jgi:formate dehydrogenase subunit gamma